MCSGSIVGEAVEAYGLLFDGTLLAVEGQPMFLCYLEELVEVFVPKKPTSIQVDASQKGLGAALVQDGKPIAFASKSLSEVEQRYANIERELLAVVLGCERLHTYLFSRLFTVESDHKPLEMIRDSTV